MTVLSRLTKLGMAKEATAGTYLVPTVGIPFSQGTKYVDVTEPLRDESFRANDAVVQGIVAGPQQTTWQIDVNGYADLIGHFFAAMGLFDTVTAGVSTTLSAATTAGAVSITTAATIPATTTIKIGTGAAVEYAVTGTPSGAGPYTIPITSPSGGLVSAHSSADPVVSQTLHTFKQNRTFSTQWPTYAFTTDDGVEQRGWTMCTASDLQIKIDPKGLLAFSVKYAGAPSAVESTFTPAFTAVQPAPGWAWTVTNGGGSSTRGLTFDCTMKRAQEVIHASTGLQGPREVFDGAMEIDGTYKAIFENTTDIALFRNYTQTVTTHTITNPLSLGGAALAITMSQSGYTTAEVDLTATYTQLTQSLSGIQNTADGGITAVTLKNYQTTAY